MVLLEVLESLAVFAVVLVALTQVVSPLIRGTMLFPWFRSQEHALERERARILQALKEEEAQAEIDTLQAQRRGHPHEPKPDTDHVEPGTPSSADRDDRGPDRRGL